MAESFWNKLGKGQWEADSAGPNPAGYVHPLAIRVMREAGFDLSTHRSKSLEEFRGRAFDLVVTVCDNARESCPVFPGARETLHWPFADPVETTNEDDATMEVFRWVRDAIRAKIDAYLEERG